MAKQLNVDLNLRANTQQAKSSLSDLQKTLNQIMNTNTITINDVSIEKAKQAAQELSQHLRNATNVNTGKLDLGKLSSSLQKSGQDLKSFQTQLSRIGPEGNQAFLQLAQSIAAADASAITLSSRMSGFLTTLKNTARWQISSSILHGFMGAIQGAYGYAQDLNKSLNNIRIVTGQSTDQMAAFAREANNAAKALSTSTLNYTDAALIYYQQGIRDQKEIEQRTTTTIKLANVSRQSAEDVSSEMTAIWNNFAKGGKNLEYYADVITALGAATASSSEEIAAGLQKFASVADTVGLSYEKASAALATIVAVTRQSEDVVGTALKTIFARVDSLKLGETLEDGVSLNKYAKALETVGVNILDSNQNLKDMDTILDELGNKWSNISEAQRVALAETVAGQRQYAQFMALMNNYDQVLANQQVAQMSEGTLQKQQEIYAESWEAARDRVKASWQTVYNQLLDDKAFINILNTVSKVVNEISSLIDNLGGLKTILSMIGTIVINTYATKMPAILSKLKDNFMIITGQAEKVRQNMLASLVKTFDDPSLSTNNESSAQVIGLKAVTQAKLKLAQETKNLTEQEILERKSQIELLEIRTQNAAALGKEIDANEQEIASLEKKLRIQMSENFIPKSEARIGFDELESNLTSQYGQRASSMRGLDQDSDQWKILDKDLQRIQQRLQGIESVKDEILNGKMTNSQLIKGFASAAQEVGKMDMALKETEQKTKLWTNQLAQVKNGKISVTELKTEMTAYRDVCKGAGIETSAVDKALDNIKEDGSGLQEVIEEFRNLGDADIGSNIGFAEGKLSAFRQGLLALGADKDTLLQLEEHLRTGVELTEKEKALLAQLQVPDQPQKQLMQTSAALGTMASSLMNVAMIINSIKSLGNIWSDQDLSTGEKILQTLMSVGMVLPMVIRLFGQQNKEAFLSLAAHSAAAMGIQATTKAEAGSIPVKIASGEAGWVSLGPLLLFVGIAAAVVAGIVAIVAVLKKMQAAREADRKSAENAAKAAEELQQAYESTKQAYEDLKSTISNYDSAKEALDTLTEGTREWRDKLREANNEARQLIETYPELAKYSHYTSQGLLEISQEGLDEALEKQSQKVSESMSSAILAKVNAEVLSARADVTDLKNSQHWRNQTTDIASAIGYLAPIPGLAVVPSIFNAAANEHDSKIDRAIDEAVQAYAENAELVGKTDTQLAKMFDVTSDLIPKIRELGEATRQATENMAASTKEALVALYEGNSDIKNASAIADIVAGTGQQNSKEFQKLVAQYTAAAADRGIFNTGTSVSKEVWDEYAKYLEEELGYEQVKATNFKGDGTVEYSYVDDKGQVQTKQTATAETIGTTVATAEYNKQQELLGEEFAEITKNLNQESMEALSLVARRVNGEFASEEDKWRYIELMNSGKVNFSSLDISDWAKLATGSGAISAEMRTGRDIYNRLIEDMGLNDEILQPYLELKKALDIREESATAVSALSKVKTALKEVMTTEDWTEIDNQLQAAGIKNISSESLKGLTYEQQKNVLDTAYRSQLESMVKASQDAINQGQKTISARERQAQEIQNSPQWKLGQGLITSGQNAARERYQQLLSKDKSEVVKEGLANIFNPANYIETLTFENPLYKKLGSDSPLLLESSTFNIKDYNKGVQKNLEDLNLSLFTPKELRNKDVRKQILEEVQKNGFTPSFSNLNNPFDTLDEAIFYTDENFNKIYSSFLENTEKEYKNFEQNNPLPWFKELQQKIENLQIESLKKQVEEAQAEYQKAINTYNSETIRASATLQELDNNIAYGNSLFEEGWLKTGDYSQALISMASNYENAADEVAKFNLALSQNDEELLNAAENSLRLSIRVGELAEQYGLTAEDVEMQARLIQTQYQDQGQDISGEAAAEMAGRNQRLNRGVKTLSENFESWNEILQTADSLSTEYTEALNDTYEALADLTGAIDTAHIPLDFLNKQAKSGASRLDLMAKAAEGDQEAIRELNYELARTTFENLDYSKDVLELTDDNDSIVTNIIGDPVVFEETKNRILQTIETLYNEADSYNIGDNLTDEGWAQQFIQDLNEMAAATGMTVEEMNSYLSQMGVDIPVETDYIEQTRELPEYVTHHRYVTDIQEDGIHVDDYSWSEQTGNMKKATERIPVAKIGKNAKITYTGGGSVGGISNSSTSGGSGGTSSAPKREPVKNTSNETERYHVINKETEQLTKAYDRLNTAKDRAFGTDRIKLMDAEIANMRKQIALNKEYVAEAQAYAQQDYNNLINGKQNAYTIDGQWYSSEGLRGLGVELQLNENGVIQNYDEIMAAATARYNERIAAYNANPENSNLKEIADAEFNAIKELISQYEETNGLVQDKLDENKKLLNQLQDLNFERYNYKIELRVKIADLDKKRLEYELKEIGDDAFKSAEALSKMFSATGDSSQWTDALDRLQIQKDSFKEIQELFAQEEISEQDYIEGLSNIQDNIYEQLTAILDLKDTMEDYYKNTLSKLKEKYDELRTAMSKNNEILEHTKNILELIGESANYDAIGEILKGQAAISQDIYETSQQDYLKNKRLEERRRKELAEAEAAGGAERIAIAKKNLQAAEEARRDSYSTMLSDLADFLTKQKAVIDNNIAKAYAASEDTFTNGLGFDYLNQVMELAAAGQERYYTKTNQIYETEKMRRKLQQDMDKTTNTAARQRLALFDRELQALRDKNELSKVELSLAQGRYELLLAQIALEEAQNAKTTVRLQRDAEGNYGYVYTADQNAIAEAEQNVADKENDLYNTAREAEAQSLQDTLKLRQEWLERDQEIDKNETLSFEQKQQQKAELEKYYLAQLMGLEGDHAIALAVLNETSATQMNDTWTTGFQNVITNQKQMITDFQSQQEELNTYLYGEDGESGAFGDLKKAASEVLGPALSSLGTIINQNTEESKKFREELIGKDGKGGVVKAAEDEANAVAKTTIEFGKAYDKAEQYIQSLKDINTQIDELIKKAAEKIIQEYEVNITSNYPTPDPTEGQRPPESSGTENGDNGDNGGKSPTEDDSSTYKIYLYKSKDGKAITLGTFKTEEEAIDAFKTQTEKAEYHTGLHRWSHPNYSAAKYAGIMLLKGDKIIKEMPFTTPDKWLALQQKELFKQGVRAFDTGGYTGQWYHSSDDPMMSGKLAMLHEKELVLNQEDTKNFLASIEMVRDLARVIDLQAAAVGMRQQLEARLGFGTAQGELAQNIVIHADFPNATDHNEIMEAFETLADRAAQYANRADRTLTQAQETYNKAKLAL